MRHVQVQRASARDEPINLRRESTLSIVSQSFVRSFVRSSRSFVRSSRAHRARARVDVSVMIPPRRDRSIVSRARLTIGRRDRDRRRDDTYFYPPFTRSSRARPPPRPSRASLARDRTHLRATRRRDAMMIERVHRRSSRRTQHGARRSNASKKTPRFFSRSSFALPRRVARRRVAFDRSDRSNRIESRRGVDSSRVVLILES